ncbi:Uncharacterised protein [Campylobacter hyointestinalis]|uniref:hypothetical protein n=1 Tax=Campylobacter hyointestinalis TaxID=198 RepID=UPI000723B4CC|nr:hypothetical protein [Campylobacter hyointestinalis]CUU89314.1 Uncharacterised protein [Campylobacter hyointestinalis]
MIEKRLNQNFSIADNRIAQCKELDFNAKGLYLYILSLPEDWEFSIERIAYMTNNSVGKVKAGLKQLEAMGLFVRELLYKGVKGKRAKYVLFDFDTRTTTNNDESVSIDEKSTDEKSPNDKSMIEKSTIKNQPIDFHTFNKQRNNIQRNNINKIINLQKGACVHTHESEQSEQNEAFKNLNLEAFSKWVKYCEQKGFKIVGIQFDELKKYLCKFDKKRQEQIISYSIANGYKGLYEPKAEQSHKSGMSDEELDKFFAMQKNDDPVLSNNWLSKGLPQEVKSFNQHLDSSAIPEDFKRKFLIGDNK